ncbi:MAG TPA: GNAT family N-acetyltransferase [Candidatus Acidoferrum sp.]|nr:GNAT family N-acetyltransferase [Candidatus Acidoferrum sp.]
MQGLRIIPDDLTHPKVQALLEAHLSNMHSLSPPESVHAFDVARLRSADVTFWTMWLGEILVGCGALKQLNAEHGEIKSMRTRDEFRGRGAGRTMLAHIIAEATRRGYRRLSLETGSVPAFQPALRLYETAGFRYCEPFADYVEDPYSVFMTIELAIQRS